MSALDKQEGGTHYLEMPIQPIEYITKNKLDWYQGNIVKYASRHHNKGGADDLRKVLHYAKLALEAQYGEKKSAIEDLTNPEMEKLMLRIHCGVLNFKSKTGKNPVRIELGTKEMTLLDGFCEGPFFDLEIHSSYLSSLCILVGPDGYEFEVL